MNIDSTEWLNFLQWTTAHYPSSTNAGGPYGRRADNGMDASENMNYLPTELNFWIWRTRYRETLTNADGSGGDKDTMSRANLGPHNDH